MERNTYRDCVTYQELCDARGGYATTSGYIQAVKDGLAKRSGVFNTTAGTLWVEERLDACCFDFRVTFDSAAWTGRTQRHGLSAWDKFAGWLARIMDSVTSQGTRDNG